MDTIGNLFTSIFRGLRDNFQEEIKAVSAQFPHEPFRYCTRSVCYFKRKGKKAFNVMYCIGPSAPLISDFGLFWANETDITEANIKIFRWDQV